MKIYLQASVCVWVFNKYGTCLSEINSATCWGKKKASLEKEFFQQRCFCNLVLLGNKHKTSERLCFCGSGNLWHVDLISM